MQEIEQLDGHDWWKLKAICSKISIKLITKFKDDNLLHTLKGTYVARRGERSTAMQAKNSEFIEIFKTQCI
jgi:hypothetical protein